MSKNTMPEVIKHLEGDLALLTDEEGHCKMCGTEVIEQHLMHDPDGGPPVIFCSAKCLYNAEHIFDELTPSQMEQVSALIYAQETKK